MDLFRISGPIMGKYVGKGIATIVIIKKGDPTYVAVWRVTESEIKIVEIKYAGTHEGVDYNRIC